MEWDAPAIVLDVRPFGEGDAIATVMTEAHGAHRGLARGGASRRGAATWQPGNLIQARWVARLDDQLGSLTGELVHAAAARAMQDPMMLAVLAAGCAVAEGALLEREPHPRVFAGLIQLVRQLEDTSLVADFVRWEAMLLADLGYGLDLAACALTGATAGLRWVSPRTGRAVTETAAGVWKGRLLALPDFLADGNGGEDGNDPGAWRDGLRLTGHFLERDAFGHTHRPMPPARYALYDRVTARIARGTGEQEDQTS